MALTREQFDNLRAKGLTVEQIVKFESGQYKPETKDNQSFIQKVKNSAVNRGKDFINALDSGLNPVSAGLQSAGSVAGFANDVIGAGVSAITPDSIENKISEGVSKVAETRPAQDIIKAYQSFQEKHPEAAKDLEATINIASLLPTIKGLSLAGKGAKAGAELAGTTAKNTISGTGSLLEEAGNLAGKAAIPLSKPESGLIQSYRSKNPLLQRIFKPLAEQPRTKAITAIEKGLAGTESMIGVQAKREMRNLWDNSIYPAVKSIKDKFNINQAIKDIEKEVAKTAEPGRRKGLIEAVSALKDDYKGYSVVSFEKAQQIKSGLDKFLPEKMFKGKPIASTYKEVQKMLADKIRKETYNKLGDSIKTDYLDYGNLKNLAEWGQTAMTGAKKRAGFGNFVSSLWDNATVPVLTTGSKILRKAGQTLKSIK